MKKIMFIFGTRPEAIKLAPVIKLFKNEKNFLTTVCSTGQHKEMLEQVLDFFKIKVDYNLTIMKKNQTLFDSSISILSKLQQILYKESPDVIFVQGDTTTAFIGTLAAFYKKIKVAHIEAGLRSFNKYSPFPEEINRVLISHIADYHFAPTQTAKKNLEMENIRKNVWIVGNTVIDALYLTLDIIKQEEDKYYSYFNFIDFNKKIILVTGHRRENFGEPFKNICLALKELAEKYEDKIEIIYPVHLNPNVKNTVNKILSNNKNIHLISPIPYPYLVWLMYKSYFILTDSGGIQEEAPSLGKPVLVMRDVTEREEGIKAGTSKLVGTSKENIIKESSNLLENQNLYIAMSRKENPYGDGKSSQRILNIIKRVL